MKEQWEDIPNYEGYQVSNMGRVKSLRKEIIMPYGGKRVDGEIIMKTSVSKGYHRITLCQNGVGKTFSVARLVLIAFSFDSDLCVNHKNGIKIDNRLENLEWCTYSENMIHAYETGLSHNGQDSKKSKLTDYQVARIKFINECCDVPLGFWRRLANKLNVDKRTISAIINNISWKHIEAA